MLILRIRQAECALKDGRLDEAYQQAVREDVRQHRRGQRLISRVVDGLLQRGHEHLKDGRCEQALLDCDRAARLGGNQPRISELRLSASAQLSERQRRERRRNRLIGAARQQVGRGEFTLGAQFLQELDEQDVTNEGITEDIAIKRAAVDAALARAEEAVSNRAHEAAIRSLLEVKSIQPANKRLVELSSRLTNMMVDQIRNHIDQGRLDMAHQLLNCLSPLSGDQLEVTDLSRALEQCRLAMTRLLEGDVAQASRGLNRMAQLLPNARWVKEAAEHARQAVAAVDAVRDGPLGLLAANVPLVSTAAPQRSAPSPDRLVPDDVSGPLPRRFLIQVDGGGSYLVVRGKAATFGPISSTRRPDVSLLAQADAPMLTVERLDGDHFLRCEGRVLVNDKTASEKLLSHGDKITLGRRCSMRFLVPNAASTSAVIELSGAKLSRGDTRHVVLLDETMVLGNGASAHVHVEELESPRVLYLREGQLHCREAARADGNGRPAGPSMPIAIGKPVSIGPASIVITPWDGA